MATCYDNDVSKMTSLHLMYRSGEVFVGWQAV